MALAWPRASDVEGVDAENATTGVTLSPPPVAFMIWKTTGAPPTGRPSASVTVATMVETPDVEPTLFATTLGEVCSVIFAATAAVIATLMMALALVWAGSNAWTVARPAWVVVRVAHAFPATAGTQPVPQFLVGDGFDRGGRGEEEINGGAQYGARESFPEIPLHVLVELVHSPFPEKWK